MAGWMNFLPIAMIASTIATLESRVIPSEPVSVVLDAHGYPVMLAKERRTAIYPYAPRRATMFGYYRSPMRRSNDGGQATGVFTQGNTVSGETFVADLPGVNSRPKDNPRSIGGEAKVPAASETPAAPEETYKVEKPVERKQETPSRKRVPDNRKYGYRDEKEEQRRRDEYLHRRGQDFSTSQQQHEPEQIPLTTEMVRVTEEPSTEVSVVRSKEHRTKKVTKTPVNTDNDDNDEEEEADEEDDEPIVPFVPFKGNKNRQRYPNLNNFFPMIFSFPRVIGRAASAAGSPPGAVTAIANSYSTGKGGVASSVATAYGGSPVG